MNASTELFFRQSPTQAKASPAAHKTEAPRASPLGDDQAGFSIGGVKADIKFINWIVGKEGLSLAQRELLHEEISSITRMGGKLTKEESTQISSSVV